jgi:DNA-directed RNA polymerase subunit RPC12/RpoP
MTKKRSNLSERSKCCGFKVVVRGKTTMHYVCLACGQPCDIYYNQRKTWIRNPKTKILEDERGKIKEKEINKEIQEIGHA